MVHPRFQFGELFAELSRRKVIRVAMTYGIVGFAVIEAADIIVDAIGLPLQFTAFVIVAVFLGFPIAIVLAWSYEIVPDHEASLARASLQSETSDRSKAPKGISVTRALITVSVIAILGVSWYELRQPELPPQTHSDPQYIDSIAVLPLNNHTGDPGLDHVGIAITEEIITHLAKIPPLKVISRHSVQAAAAQNLTIPQVASVLSVRHVIEGSIQLDGDRIRVSLQHIDAENDAHLWADNLGGPLTEMVRVQENIAQYVTAKVVDLIPGLVAPTLSTHVDLGPGQEAYLEGKKWLGDRTPTGVRRAIDLLEASLAIDPDFAPANAELSSAYSLALSYRYDIGVDGYTAAARAMLLAENAISLDRNLAAGYAARGLLGILVGQSPLAIAADFDRAESLSPNIAANPSWRSLAQAQLGNTDAAFAEAARAVELDPLSPARRIAVANVAFQLGRYDEAIAAARIATALEPRIIRARAIEARSQILGGNPERCAELILSAYRVLRATCLLAAGRSAEASAIVDRVLDDMALGKVTEPGYSEVITYEELAVYFAMIGNVEKAQEYLMLGLASSPAGIEFRILDSPLFARVRADRTFSAAISSIRVDLYDRVKRIRDRLEATAISTDSSR